jgi:Mn-dependent DtxR family transcriptional regulator
MGQLTETHLRYLLAIYEISLEESDVSSMNIAGRLKVRKSTVSVMMDALMCRKLLIKKRYGKVYLTDDGYLIARRLENNVIFLMNMFEKQKLKLTAGERHKAAVGAALTMPEIELGL